MLQQAPLALRTGGDVLVKLDPHLPGDHQARVVERVDSPQQKLDTIRSGIVVEALHAGEGLDDLDSLRQQEFVQGPAGLRVGGFLRIQAADRQQEQDCTRPGQCDMPSHGTRSSKEGPPSSAPRPIVYPSEARGVNRSPRLLAVLLPALLTLPGCAVTPPTPRHLLALRYDGAPAPAGRTPEQPRTTFRRDLGTLADLGFPTVVLTNVDDAERVLLLDAAEEVGLTAVVGARSAQQQLARGEAAGQALRRELKRAWPAELRAHPAWEAALLDARTSTTQYHRALQWARALSTVPLRIVCLGPNVGVRDEPGILTIQTTQLDLELDASLTQQALWRYHMGLQTGRTGGLLFDRYRALPPDAAGLVGPAEPLSPALSSAVQALAERAGRWGPKLYGARARAVPISTSTYHSAAGTRRTARRGDLAVTEFVRGNRRYLMVFNRALDRHVRGPCVLPALIGELEVRRAVEIPGSSARVAGQVVRARTGELTLQLDLRPADAVLYELF